MTSSASSRLPCLASREGFAADAVGSRSEPGARLRQMPALNAIGIVVSDMATSIRFYRLLGLEVPETPDEGHVDTFLSNGVRFMLDSEEVVRLPARLDSEDREPARASRSSAEARARSTRRTSGLRPRASPARKSHGMQPGASGTRSSTTRTAFPSICTRPCSRSRARVVRRHDRSRRASSASSQWRGSGK